MSASADSALGIQTRSRRVALVRVRALAPRYLAAATLAVLLALGVRNLFWAPSPPPTPVERRASAPSQDFALRFARAYLTYDARRPGARERALAPFLSQALATDAGLHAPHGARRVEWTQVASDQPALLGGRVITVAAGLSGRPEPLYLAVTVRHDLRRGLSLGGYPALVGPPSRAAAAPEPVLVALEQPEVATVAVRALRNYLVASLANLRADLDPGTAISLPGEVLVLREVEQLGWIGTSGSGAVLLTVRAEARDGLTYTLSYELGIELRERPYVSFIQVLPNES